MPGLMFGQRRLLLAGDEFTVPYATCACGRMVWVLFLVVGLSISANILFGSSCEDAAFMVFSYGLLSILVGALSLIVEIQIARASTYGTMIDPGPRNELLEKHLTRKAMLGAVQLVLGLFGVFLLIYIPLEVPCRRGLATITTGIILTMISQVLDAAGMYCCFAAFTTSDNMWIDDDVYQEEHERSGVIMEMEKRYEQFCRSACKWAAWCSCTSNIFGGEEQEADFAHVSRVFSRTLAARRYVDVVATDIAAGLILVRHVQKSEDYKRRDELRGGDGTPYYSTVTTDPALNAIDGYEIVDAQPRRASQGDTVQGGQAARRSVTTIDQSPARVPLHDRATKHRKYYKVSKNERPLDLSRRGEERQLLEEITYFVRYANIMYSIWTTMTADPGRGMRRIVRRNDRWLPRPVKELGARSRASMVTAPPSLPSGGRESDNRSSGGPRVRGPERALHEPTGGLFEAEIRGDNWWGSHETALRSELPEGADLVLAHFRNCLEETPYCVVLDHTWQSVVITIRGTNSFEDILVDAMAEPLSLEDAGRRWGFNGTGMHAHEGIMRRTEWIRRDLEDSGVLRLLLGTPANATRRETDLQDLRSQSNLSRISRRFGRGGEGGSPRMPLASAVRGSGFCAGYTGTLEVLARVTALNDQALRTIWAIRCVGHSLGGGCAALLALLLKGAYPTVKALAVSPPGGLVSEGACREATVAMVTSLVLNDDVIPRMSAQSVEALADQVLEVLGRSRVSKLEVMKSLLRADEDAHRPEHYLEPPEDSRSLESINEELRPPAHHSYRGDVEEGRSDQKTPASSHGVTRYRRQLERYRQHVLEEGASRQHYNRLRLPGRILRLVNTDFVMGREEVHACDDGCVAYCCGCCSPAPPDDVKACCCTPGTRSRKKRIYTPVWSTPEDLAHIRVSPAFLNDHVPEEVERAMNEMLEDLGVAV